MSLFFAGKASRGSGNRSRGCGFLERLGGRGRCEALVETSDAVERTAGDEGVRRVLPTDVLQASEEFACRREN